MEMIIFRGLLIASLIAATISGAAAARDSGRHKGGGNPPPPVVDEEFVGPFANWLCARSLASGTCGVAGSGPGSAYFNATGNGATDDTTAVQNCISAMTTTHPVCYFPAGTYKVSTTLNYNSISGCSGGCDGNNLIGHDPADTSIVWAGASGGTMLYWNGIGLSAVNRITWNGGGLAGVLIDQATTSRSDSGNLFADDVFTNALSGSGKGFRCGVLGAQCSEIELIRGTFNSLFDGVTTCNGNALNVWVWYSTFNSNSYALGAQCGGTSAGLSHSIHNIFNTSSVMDYYGAIAAPAVFLDNYSTGSNQFIGGPAGALSLLLAQRNTVLNPVQTKAIFNVRSVVALDNVIKSSGIGPALSGNGGNAVLSMGNTFSSSNTVGGYQFTYQFGDTGGATIGTILPPMMPPTPPNNNRTIYEASPSGTNNNICSVGSPCTVQAAICKAATGNNAFSAGNCIGQVNSLKNVAHIQAGNHSISATISVPANSNVQIIGDNWFQSKLIGSGVTPLLRINGPSSVVLREFWVQANSPGPTPTNDGIELTAADYAGSKLWVHHFRSENAFTSMFVDNINTAAIEAQMYGYAGSTGPSLVKTGAGTFNMFFGGSGNQYQDSLVSGSGNFDQIGVWQDANMTTTYASVTGSGTYVSASSFLSTSISGGGSVPMANFSSFTGKAAVLLDTMSPYDCTNTSAIGGSLSSGQLAVALNAEVGGGTTYINPTGTSQELFGNKGADPSCAVQNLTDTVNGVPQAPDGTFMNSVLSPTGNFRATAPALPQIGNVEMYRMYIYYPHYAIHVMP